MKLSLFALIPLLLFSFKSCGSKDLMLAQHWQYAAASFEATPNADGGTTFTPSESVGELGKGIADLALKGMEWEFRQDKTYTFRYKTFLGTAEETGAYEWVENDKYLLLVSPGNDKQETKMHKLTMVSLSDDTLAYRPEGADGTVLKFTVVKKP